MNGAPNVLQFGGGELKGLHFLFAPLVILDLESMLEEAGFQDAQTSWSTKSQRRPTSKRFWR
jgi:hypothetical protein